MNRATWGLIALFGGYWLVGAVTSRGFLEDDAWAHYLYARTAWDQLAYLADVWGRPVCTGLYALGAWSGFFACRVISLGLVFACAELTRRTARLLAIDERASIAFLLAMPLVFLNSLTVMTELPFAVLLIAAFLAYLRRRWWLMAFLVGLLPLTRPEGYGFVLLAIGALLWRKHFLELPLLLLPLIGWSWFGWTFAKAPGDRGPWWWLADHWPWSAHSSYGHGPLLQFVVLMPILVGVGMPFIVIAVGWVSTHRREIDGGLKPTLLIPLLMLVGHSLLWWLGMMASYGEIRYLLIVAPFWAMLAAVGWQRSPVKPSPVLLAVISLVIVTGIKATLLTTSPEGRTAAEVATWAKDYPRVVPTHPAVNVYLDRKNWEAWNPAIVQHPSPDVVLIWDRKSGAFNADSRLVSDVAGLEAMGWQVIRRFDNGWVAMRKTP